MKNIGMFVVVMLGACSFGELSITPLPVEHRHLQERLEESLQALQVVDLRSRGQPGPPWPTPRICMLVQNGGEELEQHGLLRFFPQVAQEGIRRRYNFAQVEMDGWPEAAPPEPEPIATDPDQGQAVNETLSDIQDENATILAGLTDAQSEVSHETLLCMEELAFRAVPLVVWDMVEQYNGEELVCLVKCLRQANAQAAQICLTVPERFVRGGQDTVQILVQYLKSLCPPPSLETPCPFQ